MPDTPCTVADLVVRCLEAEGVECVFGIPGEENIRLVAAADRSPIRFVLVRDERAAAFMADVDGRLTGKAGVCTATLGPGALNLILGVAEATTDSAPLVAITAQVGLDRIYKESHQSIAHSAESAVRHAVVAPSGCTGAPTPRGTGVTVSAQPTALGTILVDAHGRTVYEVANDTASASTRTPACGSNWPLVAALASLPGAPFRRRPPAHRRWPRHFPSKGLPAYQALFQ